MPKLEAYTEIRGALRTKKFREVPQENIGRKKGERAIAVQSLTATNADGQVIDANEVSMDRFDRVISLALGQMLLATNPTNPIWDTTFQWVDAENNPINISLRQAIELQQDGLNKLSAEWFKYQ